MKSSIFKILLISLSFHFIRANMYYDERDYQCHEVETARYLRKYLPDSLYECRQLNDNSEEEYFKIHHTNNYENFNVTSLTIENTKMERLRIGYNEYFTNLLKLEVSNTNLRIFNREDTQEFRKIIVVKLTNTSVVNLAENLFEFNKDLKYFEISDSKLMFVDPKTFPSSLDVIELSNNVCIDDFWNFGEDFDYFIEHVVANCADLNTLACIYETRMNGHYTCRVKKYLEPIHGILKIQKIQGSHKNNLTDESVEELIIEYSNTTSIPHYFGYIFPNLKVISMNGKVMEFRAMENALRNLSSLEEFHLPFNYLTYIDSKTFDTNRNLRKIDFEGNDLIMIGVATFYHLKNLTKLNLSANRCISYRAESRREVEMFLDILKGSTCVLHDAIHCHYMMSYNYFIGHTYSCHGINMDIRKTDWKTIQPAFSNIYYAFGEHMHEKRNEDVQALKIAHHLVQIFPQNLAYLLPNLKIIQMKNSHVSSIPRGSFDEFKELVMIDLAGNSLSEISFELFSSNSELISLNFDDNQITRVKVGSFRAEKSKINFLNFSGNACVDIEAIGSFEIAKLIEDFEGKCK